MQNSRANFSDNHAVANPRLDPDAGWWLPVLAWLPFAIAINSVFLPQGALAYWGRWLGLMTLLAYGFFTIFVPGQWIVRRFDKVALWVFGLIALSTLLASGDNVLLATNFRLTALIKACSLLVGYLSLTWGLERLLSSFQAVVFIVQTLIVSATVMFTIGILGNVAGVIPLIGGAGAGIFVNPNMTAALGVVMLPLAVWFAARQTGWLRIGPVVVILVALMLSRARTPLVVVVLLGLYYLLCWPALRRRQLANILFPLSLMGIGALTFIGIDFWGSPLAQDMVAFVRSGFVGTRQAGYSSYRLNLLWPLFIRDIAASPLLALTGHGWGSEEALALLESGRSRFFSGLGLVSAHSAYIGLTYQIGIIGCVSVFLPLWGLVLNQLFEVQSGRPDDVVTLKVALVGVVLAELGVCFFESGFYNVGAVHMFPAWIVVYLVTRLDEIATFSS